MDISSVKGIGPAIATQLAALGIHNAADLALADPAKLTQVNGIGPARAMMLIRAAQEVVSVLPEEVPTAVEPDTQAKEDAAPVEVLEEPTPDSPVSDQEKPKAKNKKTSKKKDDKTKKGKKKDKKRAEKKSAKKDARKKAEKKAKQKAARKAKDKKKRAKKKLK